MGEASEALPPQAPCKRQSVSTVCRVSRNEKASSQEVPIEKQLATRLGSSPGRTRTYDLAVNSRSLYQLSYRGSKHTILTVMGWARKADGKGKSGKQHGLGEGHSFVVPRPSRR